MSQRRRHLLSTVIALGSATLGLIGCGTTPAPTLLSLPLPAPTPSLASPEPLAPKPSAAMTPLAAAASASAPRFLTVRRVNVPEYLQTDAVRYRVADNTLVEWPGTAWAERLEAGLTNHLALLLRQALPNWTVCEAHCPSVPNGLVLLVSIAPMDYLRPQGQLRSDVSWRVTGPGSAPTPLSSGSESSLTPVQPDSPVGQAAAMAAVLNKVSQGVVQALR